MENHSTVALPARPEMKYTARKRVRPIASSSWGPRVHSASMLKPMCQIATWVNIEVSSCHTSPWETLENCG